MLLYNLLLGAIFAAAAPKALYQLIRHGKGRRSLSSRLGFAKIPVIPGKVAWIHAVSVGEAKAACVLAQKLQKEGFSLIISSVTETGHEEACRSIPGACAHIFLPFDFPGLCRRIVKKINPKVVIVMETDLWYNFLHEAKKTGAKVLLANGKISENSFKWFSRIPFFAAPLFALVDYFFVQTQIHKERFKKLGVPAQKISVTGNLKLQTSSKVFAPLQFWQNGPVVVFGSTHKGEEELFLAVLKKLPGIRAVLVPRHPERFDEVEKLLKKKQVAYSRAGRGVADDSTVVLLDRMGELQACYAGADLAVVGGSFVDGIGGHNIIEPIQAGKPVLFGPCMDAQQELLELVLAYGAGKQVKGETLANEIQKMLCYPDQAIAGGQKLIGQTGSALEEIITCIKRMSFAKI